jgi:HAD superfamily phosphoserine phosphatase-like hydrolase
MKIAVFDVCDTLYNVNTTFSFLDNYFAKNKKYLFFRKISKLFVVKVANYFIYKTFKIDLIRLYGTRFLKNKTYQEIEEFSHIFVYSILKPKIKKQILKMLKKFKNDGYTIVLMSGSYNFIVKEVAKYVEADRYFASKLKESNGYCLGKYEKDILLDKYDVLVENFQNIEDLVVVSDNRSDLTLMKMANKAYAICNKEKDCIFWNRYLDIIQLKEF